LFNSPGGIAIKRMIDCTVTLFPEPDSPTMASVSPSCTSKFTSRTACTSPPYVWNDTDRLFTSNTFFFITYSSLLTTVLRLQYISQTIPYHIQCTHCKTVKKQWEKD